MGPVSLRGFRKWREKLAFNLQALTLLPDWEVANRKYNFLGINLSDPEYSIL